MLVVVGGHSRNIGKTAVIAAIIRATPEAGWTAVKITPHSHSVSVEADRDRPYILGRELQPGEQTDSGRFLAAGARESYWLRSASGQLERAAPVLLRIAAASRNAIFESNSVLEFIQPDLYLVVLDSEVEDFKESARRNLGRADAVVLVGRGDNHPAWPVDRSALEGKPQFRVSPPEYLSPQLAAFIRARLKSAPTSG